MANIQPDLTPPTAIRRIGENGVIMEGVVDDFLMPTGAVNWAINVNFDKIGATTVRNGLTIVGSQIVDNHGIKGLFQFLDTGTGSNDRLIAVCNTVVYALVSGVWTSKRTTLTADTKARFTNFVDLIFMVNGKEAMQSWDGGAGNFSTTNVTSAPVAYFIDNFRSRVWAAKTDTYPSRLFYSSVADGSGAILWTGTDSSYIDIAPGDGEDITAIKKFGSALYVFKNNSIYRIFSKSQTEPDPQILIGTYSQESVVVGKDNSMYWHHPSGIYRMRKGEASATEISRPVYDIIKNITRSNYGEVSAWTDDDHVYFSVGSVTVNGITLSNCVLRWTMSTEIWTIYNYTQSLVVGATYDSTSLYRVVGDNDGNVYLFDNGFTDNGSDINYELETRWISLSGLRSEVNTIRKISALHEGLVGANLGWRNGNMERREIKPIGQLKKQESIFDNQSIQGNRLKLSLRGVSNAGSGRFQGFEILKWLNDGVIEI